MKEQVEMASDFEIRSLEIMQMKQDKYFVHLNRLLYSKNCIYFYIFLIASSVTIFLYSLFAFFLKLDELPILICESLMVVVITLDMIVRIYVTVSIVLTFSRVVSLISVRY